MKSQKGYVQLTWLLIILFCVVGMIGWCLNISHIISRGSTEPLNDLIIQIAGIFLAPLGAILGFIQ